jgi:MYXO-CTERM domain-containing protein
VRTWLNAVEAGTGKTPIIYTGPSFWDGSVGSTAFGATPLWIADYGPSCPAVPNGWNNWVIWQYGDSGGSLDQDVFNGTLAQLTALGQTAPACTNQCAASARVGIAAAPTGQGYWVVDSAGHVYPDGNASFFGDLTGVTLAQPVVGIAATPSGQGYWLVAADGGVFSFGNAGFHGSEGGMTLNKPIVGMAAAPDGAGYWLVAADGGIFSFGSAGFHGSTGGMTLNKPVVGMASSPDGNGYWLVAADGGIFAFGDATFQGSAGSMMLNAPVVGMAASATGKGYWLVAADGGIFSYGDAAFHGSAGGMGLAKPIVGMAATTDDGGYWLLGGDGGIFTYGDASYLGNALGSACSSAGPVACVVASNGCTVNQGQAACGSGQTCAHGTCQATCQDACAPGSSRCNGGMIELCGHYGNVPCNTWSSGAACPAGQSCTTTVCTSPACSDTCEPGGTECEDGGLLTCTATTDGGCHGWSAPTECQAVETCQVGGCVAAKVDAGLVDANLGPLVDAGVDAQSSGDAGTVSDASRDGNGRSSGTHLDGGRVVDGNPGNRETSSRGVSPGDASLGSASAGSGGSCGCTVVGHAAAPRFGWLGLGVVLGLSRRRRRRPQRSPSHQRGRGVGP